MNLKNTLKYEQESRPESGCKYLVPDVFRFRKTQSSKKKIFKLKSFGKRFSKLSFVKAIILEHWKAVQSLECSKL